MGKRKGFALRIDETILNAMHQWAEDELRSVNAQIEYQLRESLRRAGRLPDVKRKRKKSVSSQDD